MYVDVWHEDDGSVEVTAPRDFDSTRARNIIDEVTFVRRFGEHIMNILTTNAEARKQFEAEFKLMREETEKDEKA